MDVRKLRWLLAGWVVAVVVPGIIAVVGFDVDTNSTDLGGAILVWILGYLIQLGLFMAASRMTGQQNIAGWFVASLLPWVCDWTTPVSLWLAVPSAAAAVAVAWLMLRGAARRSKLSENGIPATGVVLEVIKPKLMNVVINNVYIKRALRLRIERTDGIAPYEATLHGTFMLGEIPDVGDRLALRVDPANPQHFESVDDTAAGGAPSAAASTDSGALTDELERLTRLHASGGLSDEEFACAKARVLDG